MQTFFGLALVLIVSWLISILVVAICQSIVRRRERRRQEMKRAAQDAEASFSSDIE